MCQHCKPIVPCSKQLILKLWTFAWVSICIPTCMVMTSPHYELSTETLLDLLPNSDGKVRAAGPGPWNSAAIGPRLLVGVQDPLWPPIVSFSGASAAAAAA